MTPLLSVESLSVRYADTAALRDVSFSVAAGEALALVGESGSGKSTVALAILGLLGSEATIAGGRIRFAGSDLFAMPRAGLRALRGDRFGVVFQDPFASLNPALTIGLQVAEPLMQHRGLSRRDALAKAEAALGEVGLPRPADLLAAYPHQLSGGMQQRVLIAAALICEPDLVILDEPTTALDVTIEAQILDLLDALRRRRNLAMLFITHNLGVVNRIADRACVLYAGSVLEQGPKAGTLRRPLHPYTQGLLGAMPRLGADRIARLTPIPGRFPDLSNPPSGCIFHPRCAHALERCRTEPQDLRPLHDGLVRCWRAGELPAVSIASAPQQHRTPTDEPRLAVQNLQKLYKLPAKFTLPFRITRRHVRAVDNVSLTVRAGEVLGLVGESGSGKSTLGRCIVRLLDATAGRIVFAGHDITTARGTELRNFRASAQIIFQNPMSALNPRRRIGATIGRSLDLLGTVGRSERREKIGALLDSVGLPASFATRYPHQLSGGERQRVSIARALASNPTFIVCDEPVSALDVSVQATVLNLLSDLRDRLGLSYLFISHDLSVVAHIADRIAVMYAGVICEEGSSAAVLAPPYHPYTAALLSAAPSLASTELDRIRLRDDSHRDAPVTGCRFHRRCPRKIGAICETEAPPVLHLADGHWIRCHLPESALP